MGVLSVLAGLFIAAVVWLYLTSKVHQISDKIKEKKLEVSKDDLQTEGAEKNIVIPEEPGKLKPRFCPICSSQLQENDMLYAEMYKAEPKDKVFIHGCKYCYRPSEKAKATVT